MVGNGTVGCTSRTIVYFLLVHFLRVLEKLFSELLVLLIKYINSVLLPALEGIN